MPLTKPELRDVFVASLRESGASVSFVGKPNEHPFSVAVSSAEVQRLYRVYIWRITHGGNNRPEDEYRIQITGVPTIEIVPPFETLILGYYEPDGIFAGWDSGIHNGDVSKSPSYQVKWDALQSANLSGFGFTQKGNQEIAVAFAPSEALTYIVSHNLLHTIGEPPELEAIRGVALNEITQDDARVVALPAERRRETATLARLSRDSSFSGRVFAAYSGQCAFCGMQLRVVDAAHIIPVANPLSSDETQNGICLCGTHHRAFDRGFLAMSDTSEILVNRAYVESCHAENQVEGLGALVGSLRHQSHLPLSPGDRPTPEILSTARQVRNLPEEELVPVRSW